MTERTGRCLCGAVTFSLKAEPLAARICWCRDCQHLAANGTVNVLVATEALVVSGALAEYVKVADSGNQITRQFCPRCGTQLFGLSSGRPQFRVVRSGTRSRLPALTLSFTRFAELTKSSKFSCPTWRSTTKRISCLGVGRQIVWNRGLA